MVIVAEVRKYVTTAVKSIATRTIAAVKTSHVFDTKMPDGGPLKTYVCPFFVFSCPPIGGSTIY